MVPRHTGAQPRFLTDEGIQGALRVELHDQGAIRGHPEPPKRRLHFRHWVSDGHGLRYIVQPGLIVVPLLRHQRDRIHRAENRVALRALHDEDRVAIRSGEGQSAVGSQGRDDQGLKRELEDVRKALSVRRDRGVDRIHRFPRLAQDHPPVPHPVRTRQVHGADGKAPVRLHREVATRKLSWNFHGHSGPDASVEFEDRHPMELLVVRVDTPVAHLQLRGAPEFTGPVAFPTELRHHRARSSHDGHPVGDSIEEGCGRIVDGDHGREARKWVL